MRLAQVDVFRAVVMDAFSRRIVGWNLAPKITTELALIALSNAIESRQPAPGLIHHSDRGVQYASVAYVRIPGHVDGGFRSHVNKDSGTM